MNGTQQLPRGALQGGFPQGGPPGGAGGGTGFLPGGPIASLVILALFAITLVVLAIAFYQLFRKAGFAGALGLLMVIPSSTWALRSTSHSRSGLFSPRWIG